MRFIKTYIGSLIISVGLILVVGMAVGAMGLEFPRLISDHLLETWLLVALVLYPLARKIIRV